MEDNINPQSQNEVESPEDRVNSEQWRQKFSTLPEVSYQEITSKIRNGEKVKGLKLPFLKLDHLTLENEILIEDCHVVGVVARGTVFKKKVTFNNCIFAERLQMSAHKQDDGELKKSVFCDGLEIKRCCFDDTFTLRNGDISGEVSFIECHMANPMALDRTVFHNHVNFVGPGKIAICTMYRARMNEGLNIQDYIFSGGEESSLDLNESEIKDTLSITRCQLEKNLEIKKARIGSDHTRTAWVVESTSLNKINLSEAVFYGNTEFSQVECLGDIEAEPPRETHGKKAGRPTLFQSDVSFIETQFKGKCSFHGTRFLKYANFKKCTFHKGGDFNQAEFGQVTGFWECSTEESIHFRKAIFSGRTQFGRVTLAPKSSFNEAVFQDDVTLFDSKVLGDIFFSRAYFTKDFKIRAVQFEGGLGLEKITVEGALKITDNSVKDRFILSESVLNGHFLAPGLSIGTWGTMAKSIVRGEVDLAGLEVGKNIQESEGHIQQLKDEEGQEEADQIPGTFYFDNAVIYQNLKLGAAKIRGKLCFDRVNVYGEVDLYHVCVKHNLVLSRSYIRGMVNCDGLRCANLASYKARFKEEVSFNGIVCQDCSLSGSSFDGGFTMRGADITGSLVLNTVDVDGKADLFNCKFNKIFFYNFLVDNLLISRKAFGERLSAEEVGNYKQAQNEYGILKQAFHQSSKYDDMDWAYYRFCRAHRRAKEKSIHHPINSLLAFLDWLFLDIGFGYGTRPMNIGGIALGVILIFALIFSLFPGGIVGSSGKALTSINFLDALYLSVATFSSVDYGNSGPYFDHWLKYVFSIEGLLGIFLTTLFVATVSRKIIRA